jgi:hypothetical protein
MNYFFSFLDPFIIDYSLPSGDPHKKSFPPHFVSLRRTLITSRIRGFHSLGGSQILT